MKEKKLVENIFNKYGIVWNVKVVDKFINPGCKKSHSIYSKLTRLYSTSNNKHNFNIQNSNLNDLLRMTITVEYSEIINTINKLRKSFPDLTGYIKSKKSGYNGIHLNLKMDGITCEIQLAPASVVMAVDYLHTLHEKWRDFDEFTENYNLELREKEISNITDIKEKNRLIKQLNYDKKLLKEKILEERHDFNIRKNTYDEVYKKTNFFKFKKDINNAITELNKMKIENYTDLNNTILKKLFNKNLTKDNNLDKDTLKDITNQLPSILEEYQEKFVSLIENCLETN